MDCVAGRDVRGAGRRGFTLSEMMVVVAVLVVLLAILLPSMGDARRVARTAYCATNQRSITLAMIAYAGEWNGAILGIPYTSSAHLFNSTLTAYAATGTRTPNEDAIPEVFHAHDWTAPTARIMGVQFNAGGTKAARAARFMQLSNYKPFVCPENDLVATAFIGNSAPYGPNLPVHRVTSYSTSWCFQTASLTSGTQDSFNIQTGVPTSFDVDVKTYKPRILLVGNPSQKVYLSDSAKWYDGDTPLSFTTTTPLATTTPVGFSSDYGPWTDRTRGFYTGGTAATDGRPAAMRHGKNRQRNLKLVKYKFNVAFFDGHVETVDGLTGSNPSWWVPSKGTVDIDMATDQADFRAKYCPGGIDPKIQ